jgi:D-alanyl-D-alanine carboxypeptidase/D-alanyl-D-alanine-endopeptidase (penicillin-binding protein 4)
MKDTLKWGEGWCWDDKNPTLTPLLIDRKDDFLPMLISALANYDIVMTDITLKKGTLDEEAKLLCERKRSIDQILLRMMKDSDNLYAESMYYQIAARNDKWSKALYAQRQQRAVMERAGLKSSIYRLADGSGLSLYNYLSAECLLRLLRYAYRHKPIYDHLLPSLPVAGEDGTLKKRMKDTRAEGNVQAKTGTLTGIISLAGYCTASNGHRLCFAIINQGVQRAREARDFQDKICDILCE